MENVEGYPLDQLVERESINLKAAGSIPVFRDKIKQERYGE